MANEVRSRLQKIAKTVQAQLPANYGFFVLCFPFDQEQALGEYVSNAKRSQVVEAMQNFINDNPMQEIGRN